MSTFTKIAFRNCLRNPSRSWLTIGAVAVGLCCLVFLKGFIDGADRQMVANYTDLLIGHIQIHKTGFQKNMDLTKTINSPEAISSVLRRIPEVIAFSPRIKDFALASSAENSAGIMLMGVDPVGERSISKIHQHLRSGRFFVAGNDNNKIIIGKQLSENLNVTLSDKVVIMSQGADGSMAAAAFEVCGIMETGAEEIDKNLALITLQAAQDLLVLNGKISEICVKTASVDIIEAINHFIKQNIDLKIYEALSWKDISPMTHQWLQFDQAFAGIILLIVLLVVASGILNTILMGVLERTREFGIMLALGTKPRQIVAIVTTESFLLGSCGTLLGTASGVGLVLFFGAFGINLSSISKALNSFYIGSVVYTHLDPASVGIYAAIVLGVSIVVAIVPANKASQLTPIEAIRQL
jgi:putative ABC transport system permease protein